VHKTQAILFNSILATWVCHQQHWGTYIGSFVHAKNFRLIDKKEKTNDKR